MGNLGTFLLNQIFGNQPAVAIVNPFFGTFLALLPNFQNPKNDI